jgi:AcrR family transcriptional regulator
MEASDTEAVTKASARKPGASGVQLGEAAARAMVLRGAALVFMEHGVRAASVEHILAAAGLSRRTFYRLYQGKEEVMDALYRMGTEGLLLGCRMAVSMERDPLRRIERCIDVHLRNAKDLGHLVWVLGGEAQHQESSLHTRRMEVHAALADLLAGPGVMAADDAPRIDPLAIRAVLFAVEGAVRLMLEECDLGRKVTPAALERTRRIMMRVATATLAGEGPGVAPIPLAPAG